ncbi:MAG: DUF2804 domain-containing protein [Parashewanella sp.]
MLSHKTELAPDCLMDGIGKPIYGQFDGIVRDLGLKHFHYFNDMDKPASWLSRYFDYKQFQFISIKTPHFIIGAAIADIRYLGSGFCYLYDIHNNQLEEVNWLRPPKSGYTTQASPRNSKAFIGNATKKISFTLEDGTWLVEIATDKIQANVRLVPETLSLPIAMCSPTGYNGWTYTQKHNAIKPVGTLSVNNELQPLNHALASYDFSAGYMRRETSWRWASINTKVDNTLIGLNLASGVNETGSCENVLWVNGERHLLTPVHFKFDRHRQFDESWHIYSENGQVDLHFTPRNVRSEKLNLWLLKSNFRQFIGDFNGYLIDNQGHKHVLSSELGFTEDHFARW